MYILLPLVLGLWGYIGWKIVDGLQGDEATSYNVPAVSLLNDTLAVPETYTLQANYRDPFLGKSVTSFSGSGGSAMPKKNTSPKKTITQPAITNWPVIVYGGMIQKKQGQPLALLQVNGQDYLLKTGEKAADISVISIHRDSVVLNWNKQKRGFKK